MKKIFNIYSLFIAACLILSVCVHPLAYAVTFDIPQKVSQGRGFLITIQDNSAFSGKILWQKKKFLFGLKKTPKVLQSGSYWACPLTRRLPKP